jgi:transcriptional regulator with XRE-family HTH domain
MTEERRAFGERLRQQRERRHVTLEAISETTKIATSLFAGLERGDCRRWPAGVYSRSFIRAYATAVELDPDLTAAQFERLYHSTESPPPPNDAFMTAGSPLRLGFASDSAERWYHIARRSLLAISDLVLVLTLASVLTLMVGQHFWVCLAVSSLVYQITGRVTAEGSLLEAIRLRFGRGVRREPAPDSAEAEADTTGSSLVSLTEELF